MEKIVDIIINDGTFIRISIEHAKKDLFWYDTVTVDLYSDQNCWTLFNGFAIDIALCSINLFSRLLAHDLVVHSSLNNAIGYLWNEYLHEPVSRKNDNRFVLLQEAGDERPYWVGLRHLLWENCKTENFSTFFFESNFSFYLEVAPVYRWHHRDPEPGEEYCTYEEFIKNYKSLAMLEIPRAAIEQLYETFEELQAILESNDDRFKDRLEEMGIFVVKAGDDNAQKTVDEITYCKPKDGQRALDNSLEIRDSDLRVAIEDDTFAKLRVTHKETREYQGYLADWKELDSKTQKILHNAGWVITEVE